jgi:hypothetical protein
MRRLLRSLAKNEEITQDVSHAGESRNSGPAEAERLTPVSVLKSAPRKTGAFFSPSDAQSTPCALAFGTMQNKKKTRGR